MYMYICICIYMCVYVYVYIYLYISVHLWRDAFDDRRQLEEVPAGNQLHATKGRHVARPSEKGRGVNPRVTPYRQIDR